MTPHNNYVYNLQVQVCACVLIHACVCTYMSMHIHIMFNHSGSPHNALICELAHIAILKPKYLYIKIPYMTE